MSIMYTYVIRISIIYCSLFIQTLEFSLKTISAVMLKVKINKHKRRKHTALILLAGTTKY
jgi:hypothetical protein